MRQFCVYRNGESTTALIGVGGNLPGPDGADALGTCRRAVGLMDGLAGVRVCGLSRWFRSAPVPPSGQPPYVNAVAMLRFDGAVGPDPAVFLGWLQALEAACGRERSVANAARSLDLDIIAMGGLIRAAPDPVLPHPRAHLRAFVLAPLVDVAPDWVHPVLGRTAGQLLAQLPAQDIVPISG
jgi:2-amino-4-hydroxy-6-hydroxymethyldihydropteridine diphosphokinase